MRDNNRPLESQAELWLRGALNLADGEAPFRWQEQLLARFTQGHIPRALDIPTGLGKTAVVAIWLVARACGAPLPRRLVYVVDRRAVVDQATEVAEQLRDYVEKSPELKSALGLNDRALPISTLRGQYVDNREWLEDPTVPAIIVGTIDMIGSRLLFEGYGTSRKMRPYHAGLLGADALFVLDEAHLTPAFEALLTSIAGTPQFGAAEARRGVVPPVSLMCLSATGRTSSDRAFGLASGDLAPGSVTRRRLDAVKRLKFALLSQGRSLAVALADQAWELARTANGAIRCIVYCDKRDDALKARARLDKLAGGDADTELLVGSRRVFERQQVWDRLKELGFMAGSGTTPPRHAFLLATSAGEVGVDLDADHEVMDAVSWERVIQRLGRVNRRGFGAATVVVLTPPEPTEMQRACELALRSLPQLAEGAFDASPGAIRDLTIRAGTDSALRKLIDMATAPVPRRPALTRALLEAWSMTSLKEHASRPQVDPWLRGWVPDERQTRIVWRTHLPVRSAWRSSESRSLFEGFFEVAPVQMSEVLETETARVVEWLGERANALMNKPANREESAPALLTGPDVAAVVLGGDGAISQTLCVRDFLFPKGAASTESRKGLSDALAGRALVVDARVGGLKDGLLNSEENDPPPTADDGPWRISGENATAATAQTPPIPFRAEVVSAGAPHNASPSGDTRGIAWREAHCFTTRVSDEGEETEWLVVRNLRNDGSSDDATAVGCPQLLNEHQEWTERRARGIATRLRLPPSYVEMLAVAARLHDEGKRAARWQRAAGAPADGVYGKTEGPIRRRWLDGYRHELGSLLVARNHPRTVALAPDLRDLALHLITAHHGWAHPIIPLDSCDQAPPSELVELATEIALRFTRLQQQWGSWGLAWWEALLRAADQQASRDNDAAVGLDLSVGDQ